MIPDPGFFPSQILVPEVKKRAPDPGFATLGGSDLSSSLCPYYMYLYSIVKLKIQTIYCKKLRYIYI
jgi:hypothetical protein